MEQTLYKIKENKKEEVKYWYNKCHIHATLVANIPYNEDEENSEEFKGIILIDLKNKLEEFFSFFKKEIEELKEKKEVWIGEKTDFFNKNKIFPCGESFIKTSPVLYKDFIEELKEFLEFLKELNPKEEEIFLYSVYS